MPFVKKEILDRLLKDEQNWLDLLREREAAARQLGKDTAETVIIRAKEFETFLRGETDPVHNDADRVDGLEESVRLVNSGWNSALEYLAGRTLITDSEREYLRSLKREA